MMRKMNLLIFFEVNREWKYMQIKVEWLLKNLKDFKILVFLHDVGKRKRNWKTFFSANLLGIYMDLHWSILQIYSLEIRGLCLMKCSSGHTFVIWKPRWFFFVFHFLWNILSSKKKNSEECRYSVVYHRTSTPISIDLSFYYYFCWIFFLVRITIIKVVMKYTFKYLVHK